ncbi:TonB-dependent receptor plug domain-containing protein [Mucilaginibacter phyllosphaerae]|uniref:TonB-dependent SusC/RagA subfamily outer membrane receptor n=1 Tax=Mucilaginibacter phyllosphaerae TaxID=1812349 RepID=A0A4Y8AA42_9SPHI|nr:TonB-dependent receptor plug domain-containing protein [Mucilaginibacter phyllosphaerae]MBB3969923.1 TonB-dependent SusC/RagA subfamily outer membrane receptor [Mucilaginibacter phyllosphaerae]TEW65296.1 TonB-dependent receptor [Mucilaginibacter phyllosphaerae]GGH16766.1 TonB-dependent receptor [Mucilaginibacter phyllosphaerae]
MAFKRLLAGLLIAAGIFDIYSFSSGDDVITRIQQQLEKWTFEHPVEKVHLHLDKPYYTAGDDIWFKAYVTIGSAHQLSAYSGVLNVELVNDQDSIKQSLKLQIANGTAFGDFALPDTIHEGNYRIRAYTQYMLNAGSDYIFDQAISIGNVITNKVFTKTTFNYAAQNGKSVINTTINYSDLNGVAYVGDQANYSVLLNNAVVAKGKGVTDAEGNLRLSVPADNAALLSMGRIVTGITVSKGNTIYKSIPIRAMANHADVQFFPESGNMINGISTRVAFKAIGTDGLGIDIKGTVVDNTGNAVAELSTAHLGMGQFDLEPQAGKTYKAEIVYPDGTKSTVALPRAADNGYVLNLYTSLQNIRLTVSMAKDNVSNDPDKQISIVAQSAGKVYYAARSKPGSSMFGTVISKSKFPNGIVQFTLFSATGEPLNERLVFIQNPEPLDLSITADRQSYSVRQKVKLNIDAKSLSGKGITGSFSVAVTDESKVPVNESSENNILANLLLTSDIKGYVEQPAYYFNNISDKTRADLDLLMLTQGYRRYQWKEIMNNKPVADAYPRQTAFTISGRVTTPGGAPVVKGKVELLNFDDGLFKLDTLTDEQGRFAFKDLEFADSTRFLVQARNAKKKRDVVVKFDTIPPAKLNGYKNAADFKINVSSSLSNYALNNKLFYSEQLKAGVGNHVITLKEVQIIAKKEAFKNSQNLNGAGNADQTFVAKDMVNFNCVRFFDCFVGRLTGVIVRNGVPYSSRGGGQMAVIIDGMFLEAADADNINIVNVQSVEVLLGIAKTAIYGSRAANGAILITTKRGNDRVETPEYYRSGVSALYPKGFYKAREFYSPQYDAKTNTKLADLRSTIFWKPNLITGDDGKTAVEYFNAGSPGNYRVVVEGIDGDGNIGRQVFRYKVE